MIGVIMQHRWICMGAIAVLVAIMSTFAVQVKVDNTIDVWFVKDDPALAHYREFQQIFGNDEVVVIAFQDEDIFTFENLTLLETVADRLETVTGVDRVLSVNKALHLRLTENQLTSDPLLTTLSPTPEALQRLRERALKDPLLVRRLISIDGRTTVLLVYMEAMSGIDAQRHSILTKIRRILDDEFFRLNKIYHVAGVGVLYDALNQLTLRDAGLFLPLSFLMVTLVLWLLLRHWGAVAIALAIVGSSSMILMGLYVLFGKSLNQVTTILPTLVLIIGVAESLHIFTEYFQTASGVSQLDAKTRIARSISSVAIPCLFTTLTTVVGFASLTTAPVAVLKDLGLFGALGFAIVFVMAIGLSAIGFSFFKLPSFVQPDLGFIRRLIKMFETWVLGHRKAVLTLAAIVALLSIIGIGWLQIDTDSLGLLKVDHPVRVDSDFIEAHVGYYTPLEFVVRASLRDGLKSPDILRQIESWQRRIESDRRVSSTFGLTDALKHVNQVMHNGTVDAYALPDTGAALEEALVFSARVDPEGLKPYVNQDFTMTRMTAYIKLMSAAGIRDVMEDFLNQARQIFPEEIQVEVGGYLPLYVELIDYLTRGQISSFALAFPLIFVPIGLFLRSAKLALLAIIPNLFPILLTLGLMGWLKIPLDIATVTIASIILGIVVDDTVHFLHRYKKARLHNSSTGAVSLTVRSTGKAMISTSLILGLGFLVLVFASVKSIIYFGLLSSLALITAMLADLVIMTALLLTMKSIR
jgi:predicted RND superfamily exporter protein